MRPSSSLLGASRLPLTTKRGNKDYYKGTRQSYVPGAPGQRTGPPGKHVVSGKAKYRIVDEQVRYYVGPGAEALSTTLLKPYVSTSRDARLPKPTFPLPSFSPNLHRAQPTDPTAATEIDERPLKQSDFNRFSRRYQRLPEDERLALVFDARKKWWNALTKEYAVTPSGEGESASEEEKTREVERRAEETQAST